MHICLLTAVKSHQPADAFINYHDAQAMIENGADEALLTTFAQKQRAPWLYLSAVLFAGFWMSTCFNFPGQLEGNLLVWGPLGSLVKPLLGGRTAAFYLNLLPYTTQLAPVAFAAPLLASVLFKFPWKAVSLGDRLAGSEPLAKAPSLRVLLFGTFGVCIGGIWLGSTVFTLLQAAGIL